MRDGILVGRNVVAYILTMLALGCAHVTEPPREPGTAPVPADQASIVVAVAPLSEAPDKPEAPETDVSENTTVRDDFVPRHWPVAHKTRHVVSTYGNRSGRFHKGIDIKAPRGTPVLAAASGVVVESGNGRGYGQYVLIEHGPEFRTRYAHLQSRLVKVGRHVEWGETIGLLGATGNATTPHVHFEVIWNGKPSDPAFFLPAWEYLPGYATHE